MKTTQAEETHTITVTNVSSGYNKMTSGIDPSGSYDGCPWAKTNGSGNRHTYKASATPKSPLAVLIRGELDKNYGSGGSGTPPSRPKFTVSLQKDVGLKTTALEPTPDTTVASRKTIGIGEVVEVEVTNSHKGNPTWAIEGDGKLILTKEGNWHKVRVQAGSKEGELHIIATFPVGDIVRGKFNVVRPRTGKFSVRKTRTAAPDVLGAYLYTEAEFLPRHVSFQNVLIAESDEAMYPESTKPINVTGHYIGKAQSHKPSPPFPILINFRFIEDDATAKNENHVFERTAPFLRQKSTFTWPIQLMYKVSSRNYQSKWIVLKYTPQDFIFTPQQANKEIIKAEINKYELSSTPHSATVKYVNQ